jgi:hypothetical protein
MSIKPKCIECKSNITDSRFPGVGCDNCRNAIHYKCAKLGDQTFGDIAGGKATWTCKSCKQKLKNRRSSIFPATAASTSQASTSANATEKSLQDLLRSFNEYRSATDDRIRRLEELCQVKSDQISSLSASLASIESKAEVLAQESVDKDLEVQGIPELGSTDPTEAALAVAADIGCPLHIDDIECQVSKSSTPALSISFKSKSTRRAFLIAGKKFNRDRKRITRGSIQHKIFVNEKPTNEQRRLLYSTKRFAIDNGYSFAWFCNGLIHLKKTDKSKLIIVRSQAQLEDLPRHEPELLLSEHPRNSLEDQQNSTINRSQ